MSRDHRYSGSLPPAWMRRSAPSAGRVQAAGELLVADARRHDQETFLEAKPARSIWPEVCLHEANRLVSGREAEGRCGAIPGTIVGAEDYVLVSDVAVYGHCLLAANGQILLAAHIRSSAGALQPAFRGALGKRSGDGLPERQGGDSPRSDRDVEHDRERLPNLAECRDPDVATT